MSTYQGDPFWYRFLSHSHMLHLFCFMWKWPAPARAEPCACFFAFRCNISHRSAPCVPRHDVFNQQKHIICVHELGTQPKARVMCCLNKIMGLGALQPMSRVVFRGEILGLESLGLAAGPAIGCCMTGRAIPSHQAEAPPESGLDA